MYKLLTAEEARLLKEDARSSWREELLEKEIHAVDALIRENLKYEIEEVRYSVESKLIKEDLVRVITEAGYSVLGDNFSTHIYISWSKGENNEK